MPTTLSMLKMSAKTASMNKRIIIEIKEKITAFENDKKNANNLLDVISIFQTDETDVLLSIIKHVHRVFVNLIKNKGMHLDNLSSGKETIELSKLDQYKFWLQERYMEIIVRLIQLLSHPNNNVQELSLCTLMKFVSAEGQTPLKLITGNHLFFPASLFKLLLTGLLSEETNLGSVILRFQEFLEFDDVRYFSLKFCLQDLKEKTSVACDVYLSNLLTLLENMSMPTLSAEEPQLLRNFISKYPDKAENIKITSYKEHKKLFTSLWLEFMKTKLPVGLYKRVLLKLHEKVLPHMTSPLLLSDFLTSSYNIGGAISLLALNGLFILINTHNLNYPDFYEKLYALFEPSVFHVKYRARFFYLADLFLTSTHLPAYLVAAFIKKLARLSLVAPSSGIMIILTFISNLLVRHPSCQVLIHRPDVMELETDPFDMEEEDMLKCKALESSLWEIKSLQSHFYQAVIKGAHKFDNKLPDTETELEPLLEISINDLIDGEMKKKLKDDVPMTFNEPKSFFTVLDNDLMSELWTL